MYVIEGPNVWPELYRHVLRYGKVKAPRDRSVIELRNVMYRTGSYQHFDWTPARKLSLGYVISEFIWFCGGNRYDLSMVQHAKLWESCIGHDGGINSNYGQYLYGFQTDGNPFTAPFWCALNHFIDDMDTRRAHIPIFQSWHQTENKHNDYPCTTGMSFVANDGILEMNVHMRSQDLFWGAGNDVPICFFLLQLAGAYLNMPIGSIVHTIDNLHLYERHWAKAERSAQNSLSEANVEVLEFEQWATQQRFTQHDIYCMFEQTDPVYRALNASPYLGRLLEMRLKDK